jgi:peptidyl-prolyl cis-trans isomerase SurA
MRALLRRYCLFLLPALALLAPAGVSARIIDRLAAVVDGEVITESEVRARAAPFFAQIDAEIFDPQENKAKKADVLKETLQMMIDEKLVLAAAEELQLSVTADEVDRGIDQILRRNNLTLADLELALKEQGSSLKKYREDIRDQLLRLKVISAKVQPKVNVTDDEARSACEADRKAQGGPAAGGMEVHLQQIVFLLPAGASPADIKAKQQKAQDTMTRLKKGEDFAKVATEVSEDSTVDLGSFDVELLDPSLGDVVKKMTVGEVAGPIQEQGLIRILKLADKKAVAGASCDGMLDQYKAALEERETEKALTSYLAELRKKAYIEVKL